MQPLQVVQARLHVSVGGCGVTRYHHRFRTRTRFRPTDRPTDYPQPRPNIIAFPFHPTVCPDPLLLFDRGTYIGNF